MRLDYTLLDVFTTEPLSGNPLAVFPHADGLLDDQMQRIARELSLSETVFVTKPKSERHTAALRIFTPEVELPFAGHPTVGAAVTLGLERNASVVRFEEAIGLVTCVVERTDKNVGHARFTLPKLPAEAGSAPERARIAIALGLDLEDIGFDAFQPSVYSAGVIFYLVPVRSAAALRRIRAGLSGWNQVFPLGHNSVYAYAATPDEAGVDFAARMFAPGMGLGEDPATGAAAAALIGELSACVPEGQTEYVLRQGDEMGRPSRIHIQIRKAGSELVHGGIGGSAVIIGQGSLNLG